MQQDQVLQKYNMILQLTPWGALAIVQIKSMESTMIYRTHLVNFGYDKYNGVSLTRARELAVASGFECVIYADQQPILSWAPVGGWRGLVTHANMTAL